MTTLEGNKLIAEFMGVKDNGKGWMEIPSRGWAYQKKHYPNNLKYHSSWNWIMEVVEKINSIEGREYDVIIWRSDCHINNREELLFEASKYQGDKLIGAVWHCIIKFIQWYNQNKKP